MRCNRVINVKLAEGISWGYRCGGRAKPRMGGWCKKCRMLKHYRHAQAFGDRILFRATPGSLLVRTPGRREYRRRRR